MNGNPRIYNAVMLDDLQLSSDMISFLQDQAQDEEPRIITKAWIADTLQMLKDTGDPEYARIKNELAELALVIHNRKIAIIIL